jgi:hypothetical protein
MNRISKFIIGLSYLLPVMTVLQYEAKTSLYRRLQTDRPAVEAKMTANHTSTRDGFNKSAYDANVNHVEEYSEAYLCQSKMDTTKCRSAATY